MYRIHCISKNNKLTFLGQSLDFRLISLLLKPKLICDKRPYVEMGSNVL